MTVLHVKPVKLDLVSRDLDGLENECRRSQRRLGRGICAGHNIGEVVLTLFLFRFRHLGFHQVVGVHQVGKVGFGRARPGILLSRQGAEEDDTNQAYSRQHQYDSTSGVRASTPCNRASMAARVLSNWLCSIGLWNTYRPSPRK